ncbi:hypothetical protein GCM10010412_028700 [Nonomuraea recticatena]|uniref:Uncharacterized protein n=1 Tax=Nonomuraea recticatena TaxID=46178 RepID=A0ABN3RPR4_9ACTN
MRAADREGAMADLVAVRQLGVPEATACRLAGWDVDRFGEPDDPPEQDRAAEAGDERAGLGPDVRDASQAHFVPPSGCTTGISAVGTNLERAVRELMFL